MPQLAELIRKKYPGEYDDMDDATLEKSVLAKYPEYADLATKEKPGSISKAVNKFISPPKFVTDAADKIVDSNIKGRNTYSTDSIKIRLLNPTSNKFKPIDLKQTIQDPNYVMEDAANKANEDFREFGVQTAAGFFNPADVIAMASGVGALKLASSGFIRGANALRRTSQIASAPVFAHGAINLAHPDSTLSERGMGLAELVGGAVGMHFPESALPPVRKPKEIPPGRFVDTSPEAGISDEATSIREPEIKAPTPVPPVRQPIQSGANNVIDYLGVRDKTKVPEFVPPTNELRFNNVIKSKIGKNTYEFSFEDELDHNLFILANQSPNKRDAKIITDLMEQTGLDETELIRSAYAVKERAKLSAFGQPSGPVKVKALSTTQVNAPKLEDTFEWQKPNPEPIIDPNTNVPNNPVAQQLEAERLAIEQEAGIPPRKPFVNPFEKPKTLTPEIEDDFPKFSRADDPNELHNRWKAIVDELDSEKAPDIKYRDIMSTGGKNSLHKGETWRGKVLEYIDQSKQRAKELDLGDDFPKFARSERGGIKIGVNIKRAADELTSGYSGALESIMVREGLQNAIDAIRSVGDTGQITVKLEDNALTIIDNGKGMNREELETVFSNLHSSGKVNEAGATGGKGVGKAPGMLGGTHFSVETVKANKNGQKIQYSMQGTPNELMEHVDITEKPVGPSTPVGTKIKTVLKTGQSRYNMANMFDKVAEHSRNLPGKVILNRYGDLEPKLEPHNFKASKDDTLILKDLIDNNEIEIRIPQGEELKPRTDIEVQYLNNGMYQFTDSIWLNDSIPNMPETVTVDIHPLAEEGSPDYPFPVQRESVKDTLKLKLKELIADRLINPQKEKKANRILELYASMSDNPIQGTMRKAMFFDPGNRLTPQEAQAFKSNPVIIALTRAFDSIVNEALNTIGNRVWAEKLEGIGIVLDPGMHGVHIPNPETKKSTILINPFVNIERGMLPKDAAYEIVLTQLHEIGHIGTEIPEAALPFNLKEINDPRMGRYLQSYINEVVIHGDVRRDTGHGVSFIKRLGEIYARIGPEQGFRQADRLENILGLRGYNREVQDLLQVYKESRGRTATTEDLLSGTGVKQESSKGGKGNVSRRHKADGVRPPKQAIRGLLHAIIESKGLQAEQASIYRTERAKRFAEFEGVKEDGKSGAAKSLGKLKGEYDKVEADELNMDTKDVTALFNVIKYARITTGEKARSYTALFKLINGEAVPQRNELALLDTVFGKYMGREGGPGASTGYDIGLDDANVADPINPNKTFSEHILELTGNSSGLSPLLKGANTMKAMMSTADLSAPLRQGIGMIHRKEWRAAFVEMFKYMGNKKYYEAAMRSIEEKPTYLLGREAGLFIAEPHTILNSEEAFMHSYIPNIPIIRDIVGFSERGYTGFLNKLRSDTFDTLIKNAQELGHEAFTVELGKNGEEIIVPTKVAENLAKYINAASGRGSLGKLDKYTNELNAVLWSPKLLSSRLTTLNPKYYVDLDPFARKEAIKSLLTIAAAGTTIASLGAAAGGNVSLDPTSSDFGKIRFGERVLDPWGGFQQPIVAAMRFLKATAEGEPGEGTKAIGNFMANKLSPAASLAWDLATSKEMGAKATSGNYESLKTLSPPAFGNYTDRYGNKKFVTKEIVNRFIPLLEADLTELLQSDATLAETIGLGTAATFGAGVQDYPEKVKGLRMRRMGVEKLTP